MHLQPLEDPEQSRGMCPGTELSLCEGCAGTGPWQYLRQEQLMQNLSHPSMVEVPWEEPHARAGEEEEE